MMWNPVIPKEEVANVLSVYWELLREVESKAGRNPSPLDKLLISGAYKVLNRAGISDLQPEYLKYE